MRQGGRARGAHRRIGELDLRVGDPRLVGGAEYPRDGITDGETQRVRGLRAEAGGDERREEAERAGNASGNHRE